MKWIAVILALSLCGCSAAQVREEFIGLSIKNVQDAKNKQVETYDMSSSECFSKIKDAIAGMKGTIAWEDRTRLYVIALDFNKAFRSSINTTQVGILTTSLGPGKSQVEIASGNNDLAMFVSKEISKRLKDEAVKEAAKVK